MAIHEDQIAFADAKSCRFLASAGTASCRAFFLRNPKTSTTVVVHLAAGSEEESFLEGIKRVAQRGDELDMYIMGGEGRCDQLTDEAWARARIDAGADTAPEIEKTLDNVFALADELGIKINTRIINLHNAKKTDNAVVDTVNGDFFYVPEELIKPHILQPRSEENEHYHGDPLTKVFDGLKKQHQRP